MPRYFIDTSDGLHVHDEEGVDLPDVEALGTMLCRTLASILRDEGCHGGAREFRAEARDEQGHRVLAAKVSVSFEVG